MKTILWTLTAWAVTTTACYGQVRAREVGSSEALELMLKPVNTDQGSAGTIGAEEKAKQQIEFNRAIDAGQSLFGADLRWSTMREYSGAGTLAGKTPADFRIGDWGCTATQFRVISKVSGSELLAMPKETAAEVMLIRGLGTSKVTDGVEFILQYPIVIQNTFSYTAVNGAQKTVLVLECNTPTVSAKIDEAIENARFRTWKVGRDTFEGKFVDLTKATVHVERKTDHKIVDVPFYRLSKKEQKWVRAESKRRPSTRIQPNPKPEPLARTSTTKVAMTVEPKTPLPKVDPSPDRARYVDQTYGGTYRRIDNGKWEVVDNASGRVVRVDTEVSRNADFVELFSPDQEFRLFSDRIEKKSNGKWQWIAKGHWEPAQPLPSKHLPAQYMDQTYGQTYRRVSGGKWEIVDGRTGRVLRTDNEISRTGDSVELFSPSRNIVNRLLPTQIEEKKNGKWQSVAKGHWVQQ